MQQVTAIVRQELSQHVPSCVCDFVDQLVHRHAAGWAAILFYGSCLRRNEAELSDPDSLLDFYVLVDDYDRAYPGRAWLARFNRLLPPNVFYVETLAGGARLCAKYAVISVAQFVHGCSRKSHTSAIWARFAQPARLIRFRDEKSREAVEFACAEAVATFIASSLALQANRFTAERLWKDGFRATYGAELRSEDGIARAAAIVDSDMVRYRALAAATLDDGAVAGDSTGDAVYFQNPLDAGAIRAGQRAWVRRRLAGKSLNLLRLIKGVFTFDGAVDYALWKVERHAGIRPPVSAWERRHPILASPQLLWRFYRAGAFR
ncbi:MAG: hypothetical protein WD711_12755 [Dongiaceae bacterium]